MSNVEVKLNLSGVRAILKSGGTQAVLNNAANEIAGKANSQVRCDGTSKPHYRVTGGVEKNYARSVIFTGSLHAKRSEAKHHYLKNSI